MKPLEGAENEGALGFFKGVGKGVVARRARGGERCLGFGRSDVAPRVISPSLRTATTWRRRTYISVRIDSFFAY